MRGTWTRMRQGLCGLAIALALAGSSRVARGELTVEQLTNNAVSGVGPYYQDVADAIRLFGNKDFEAARSHLESAKKLAPRLAPPEVMMAMLQLEANLGGAAIASLENAIQRAPQDPEAYVMLAERGVSEGRLSEAALMSDHALKVIESYSESPKRKQSLLVRAYTSAAAADEGRGDLAAARKKLELLIKLDPRAAAAHQALGRVLFRLKEGEAAYGEFKLAAAADKKMPPAELAMAGLFSDKVKAEAWLNTAIKNSGDDLRTQLGAADYWMRANQIEQAKGHAEKALKIDPNSMEANLAVGVLARLQGDYKTAATHLSQAHLLAPLNFNVTNNLALSLVESPDEESHQLALQFAELNLKQHPGRIDTVATLGWVNYRLKRFTEAGQAFQAVISSPAIATSGFMSGDMGFYIANIAKDSGKIVEATRILKESLNTDQPFAYRKLAQEMLAQLVKAEKAPGAKVTKGQGSAKSGEPAAKPDPEK